MVPITLRCKVSHYMMVEQNWSIACIMYEEGDAMHFGRLET